MPNSYDECLSRVIEMARRGEAVDLDKLIPPGREKWRSRLQLAIVRAKNDAADRDIKPPIESTAEAWAVGDRLFEDYVVEKILGEGGMGKVYLLRNQSTDQRFAVKRMQLAGKSHRLMFLRELQTWIDLPEHSNLVACRFFRTVGDEVVIFAEYVDGGSLLQWMGLGRLKDLATLLDVAIQFAWGLHVIHEQGLVHQDVKPANALLTMEGEVKVTDFGFARGRRAVARVPKGAATQNVLVSAEGMTDEYRSPEQVEHRKLTRQTDIWSWGASVLQMFCGKPPSSGELAGQELSSYLKHEKRAKNVLKMPPGLTSILRKCFRKAPATRWRDFGQVIEALRGVYRDAVGHEYDRSLAPVPPRRADADSVGGDWFFRRKWMDPKAWQMALGAENNSDVEDLGPGAEAREGQAVADLCRYTEAMQACERRISEGHLELEQELAVMCMNTALIHASLGDSVGEVAMYDSAISIRERLVKEQGRWDLADDLAGAYMNKGTTMMHVDRVVDAVELFDLAIEIYQAVIHRGPPAEITHVDRRMEWITPLVVDLAKAWLNKGNALQLKDPRLAIELYDRAINSYEHLLGLKGFEGGRTNVTALLAQTCLCKVGAVQQLGNLSEAERLNERVISLYKELLPKGAWDKTAEPLALAYQSRGNLAIADGGSGAQRAVDAYGRAVAILEQLVEEHGRWDLAEKLACACRRHGQALADLGDRRSALGSLDRAMVIRQCLVEKKGRADLALDLAGDCMLKGVSLDILGDLYGAIELYDRGIGIIERLVQQKGRQELKAKLAHAVAARAAVLAKLGQTGERDVADRRTISCDSNQSPPGDQGGPASPSSEERFREEDIPF